MKLMTKLETIIMNRTGCNLETANLVANDVWSEIDGQENPSFTIEVPSWCKIGLYIKWYAPLITGLNDWVTEKIVGYGYNGFFHQAPNCPLYYTEFSEYGNTVNLEEEPK